ncbi:dapper homolog 3-like [Osmerus mordax]|uniref:dapper homolog 3-like n=1 Tax=Osmerus mordax TaxID=8014 RepID=UPI00350ECE10
MYREVFFPMTVERSRNKERLEASLAGLCELELRKQKQECLVLGALTLGDPMIENASRSELSGFSSWDQDNLTLRRQLSSLQSSPWGLMLALEQQLGELRVDTDDVHYEGSQGDAGDSRPSSGFYESSEGQSPKGQSCSSEGTEPASTWMYTNERPKSLGDSLLLNEESMMDQTPRAPLPRSFSAPYPPLEGIAEEGPPDEPWQWDPHSAHPDWHDHTDPEQEDYQHALRVESYILGLIQRHTLAPRPCQPRTRLNPDPPHPSVLRQSSLRRQTPSHTPEHRTHDPRDLSPDPEGQAWGCDHCDEVEEGYGGEAPSIEEDCYLALPYPHSRPHSLAGGILPSLDPSYGAFDPCCGGEAQCPQLYTLPHSPASHNHLVSAQFIPSQAYHAPVCSPMHYNPEPPQLIRGCSSSEQPSSKPRSGSKNGPEERQSSRRASHHKASHSQSENSHLAQRGLPERRYSTTERPQGRRGQAQGHAQAGGPHPGNSSSSKGGRRWCSNLELSQDEGETQVAQSHRRPTRRARHGHPCPHFQPLAQPQHTDYPERVALSRGEEAYTGAVPAESESSMSEVYSPGSSSLSSDSDESGGLVWPQQLPPRLAPSSSSSSSSPQASCETPAPPKTFVKIKASHALKKKILRFRSGSLKVMTTV